MEGKYLNDIFVIAVYSSEFNLNIHWSIYPLQNRIHDCKLSILDTHCVQ